METKKLDPCKFNNRTAIDGSPLNPSESLVPFWLRDDYKLSKEEQARCTTFHYGEFRFPIGFIPISTEAFESYMESFNEEINKYIAERRTGRCVIGYKPNGDPICCPKAKHCTGCPNQHNPSVERYNPLKDRYQILSLDFCYEDEKFDIPDENAPSPEDILISKDEPADEELLKTVITYFEKLNPRYAIIIKLSIQKVPIDDICKTIGLKPSRGREEINNAYNAVCDYLNLSAYKLKKRNHK